MERYSVHVVHCHAYLVIAFRSSQISLDLVVSHTRIRACQCTRESEVPGAYLPPLLTNRNIVLLR